MDTTTDRAALGRRLRAAREDAGLSLRDVAARMGCHHPTVLAMEQGKRDVSFLEAQRLAALYGIPVTALLETVSQSQGTSDGPGARLPQSMLAVAPTP